MALLVRSLRGNRPVQLQEIGMVRFTGPNHRDHRRIAGRLPDLVLGTLRGRPAILVAILRGDAVLHRQCKTAAGSY